MGRSLWTAMFPGEGERRRRRRGRKRGRGKMMIYRIGKPWRKTGVARKGERVNPPKFPSIGFLSHY